MIAWLRHPMRFVRALLLSCVAAAPAHAARPTEVIYPDDHPRYAEYLEVLKTALDKTVDRYGPYVMRKSDLAMNESRYLVELAAGKRLNVAWSATSPEKERSLIPIRIPLSKGLLGYRILLIRADRQARLDGVRTLEDLRSLTFGVGPGWGDAEIYKAAGLTLQVAEYDSLFLMLSAGRFDVFSRGVNEVFGEYAARRAALPELAVEEHLLLHYPYPFYFFVSPQAPDLAKRIERGVRIMVDDGSFDAIFYKFNGKALAQANIASRRIITLDNPLLPAQTPLKDKRLWYRPQ